jgi:KTSC domain
MDRLRFDSRWQIPAVSSWSSRIGRETRGSQLQSFAFDGKSRVLEIEFRVTAPFIHSEIPLPPPPTVIRYFSVPRYVFTKLLRWKTARMQERYWEDHIRTRYKCQTVRTVCRLPRVWRFSEARNIRRYSFEDYLSRMSVEEQQVMQIVIANSRCCSGLHAALTLWCP